MPPPPLLMLLPVGWYRSRAPGEAQEVDGVEGWVVGWGKRLACCGGGGGGVSGWWEAKNIAY